MASTVALQSRKANGKVTITDSEGLSVTSKDPTELLEAIAKPYGKMKVVWDMDSFLSRILALLPKETVQTLNQNGKTTYNGTKLFLGIGKGQMLGVNFKKHVCGNIYEQGNDENVYQLKTFYPNDASDSLDDTLTKAEHLLDTLHAMGIKPTRLTSPAAIVSETILRKMCLPNLFNMPEEALECAEWSANYIREWRATYQIGMWEAGTIWDYDCSAAYSSILATLPNLIYADYVRTNDGSIPPNIYWGILKGTVTINKDVSPIIHSDGKAYKGSYPDFITTDDWQCIRRWDIGDFEPEAGWFIRLKKEAYPFQYITKKLYSFRGNNDLQDNLAKWMANSIWGKFAERRDKQFGEFYFPPYACMTTSKMRVADCDFIYQNNLQNHLVSVIVDGMLATKNIAKLSTEKRFGQWRANPDSPALVLSSTMQWVGDKRPANVDVHQLISAIREHPMSRSWNGIALRFLDHDRHFSQLPKNGADLSANTYASEPLNITELARDT